MLTQAVTFITLGIDEILRENIVKKNSAEQIITELRSGQRLGVTVTTAKKYFSKILKYVEKENRNIIITRDDHTAIAILCPIEIKD